MVHALRSRRRLVQAAAIAASIAVSACGGTGSGGGATAEPPTAAVPLGSPTSVATPASSATPTAVPTPSPSVAAAAHNPAAYVEGATYAITLDPAAFVARVDHPYFPLTPGSRFVFEGGSERIIVTVLSETRQIGGITATVVHDQAYVDGELAEDTIDWYAQDRDGNVWYLGEATQELEGGTVTSTAGSWEAGVDGALPGIVMPAQPLVDDIYRQEFLAGEAEDVARVIETGGSVSVRAGAYSGTVVTEDWSLLEPDTAEHKTYAPGIGVIKEVQVKGGNDVVELVEWTPG